MILNDHDIGWLQTNFAVVEPYHKKHIQPASYELHLGAEFTLYPNQDIIDTAHIENVETLKFVCKFTDLAPKEFMLASTLEKVSIPNGYVGTVEGKSSLARLGLIIHVTAGYIDPGFSGNITLEMFNMNKLPIRLYPGMKIAQLVLHQATGESIRPYGSEGLNSKYQGSVGTVESKYKL